MVSDTEVFGDKLIIFQRNSSKVLLHFDLQYIKSNKSAIQLLHGMAD